MASEELKELRDVIKEWQRFIKQASALLGCYDTTTDVMEAIGRLCATRQSAFDAGLEAGAKRVDEQVVFWLEQKENARGSNDIHYYNGKLAGAEYLAGAIRSRIGKTKEDQEVSNAR